MEPRSLHFLSSVRPRGWDDGVTIRRRGRSMAILMKPSLFLRVFACFTHPCYIFLLRVKLALTMTI